MVSEWLLVAGIALAAVSGLPGLFRRPDSPAGERVWVASLTAAGLCAAAGALIALGADRPGELATAWQVPGGRLAVRVDAISAIFALQIAVLTVLAAWYGLEYWPQRLHPADGRGLRAFYGAATAGMLLVVVARNGVLFLVGWEVMALAAFVLITTEDERGAVREAGYIYLMATRAGTLCLIAMFALLGAASGTLDLDGWSRALASPLRDAIFVLALAGFGLKAGLVPLHVWLPGAHANAPSHVSAVLSSVLIKMGIYGIVRLTALCDMPPLWWGYTLVTAGVISGVLGVGFALGQHDLKRLLAYHSVENIGIIAMGLGVAVLGRSLGRADLMTLGLAGALLHVWNHGLFKALLFLSAGAVVQAAGTRDLDRLGGLWRRMPRTGLAFLVGAVAICGLPPLNGLVSEFIIYLGLFRTGSAAGAGWLAGALAAPALALVGALAVACFVKAFGAVFLGHARTAAGEVAADGGPAMLVPMAVLATACVAIGLGAPIVAPALDAAVAVWSGATPVPAVRELVPVIQISSASAVMILGFGLVGLPLARRARAAAAMAGTWDCGYARPEPRMQYSASSFAALLVDALSWALRPITSAPRPVGPFPPGGAFHSHVPDTILDRVLRPGAERLARLAVALRPLQRGSVHLYILYIFGAVVALLLWS